MLSKDISHDYKKSESAKLLPTKKFPLFWAKFSTIKEAQEMGLKGKGEATTKAEESQVTELRFQLKRTLQRDGQSAVTSHNKSVIQMNFPLIFMQYSFIFMCAVVGDNVVGRAMRGDTICFSIFLVADTLALVPSFAVTTILAIWSHVSAKMDYFMRITLLAAGVFFLLSLSAIEYVLLPPSYQWFVLCFGGAGTIPLALLLFYELSATFPKGSIRIYYLAFMLSMKIERLLNLIAAAVVVTKDARETI